MVAVGVVRRAVVATVVPAETVVTVLAVVAVAVMAAPLGIRLLD